jgi:hypothetical protein
MASDSVQRCARHQLSVGKLPVPRSFRCALYAITASAGEKPSVTAIVVRVSECPSSRRSEIILSASIHLSQQQLGEARDKAGELA